jgi:predicted metal-dependent enzyme (double-stranded beta helix superfamily)
MKSTDDMISVRASALSIAELYAVHEDDFDSFVAAATPVCRRLLERPDLLTVALGSTGTHGIETRLLYFDVELTIILGDEPPHAVPVHDHGMWEMLGLYRGSLDHTLYERVDDDTTLGYAELREVDRRVMEPGEVVTVPRPPHDIHGFTALVDHTWLLAIIPGWYSAVRRYFEPERKSYYLQSRTPV